jgi:hypothetical protein
VPAVGGVVDGGAEELRDGGVQVDRGGQGAEVPLGLAGPPDEERDPPQLAVDGRARLPEDVVLSEVVPVVRAEDDARRIGQARVFDGLEKAPEPVVDHGQLGAVVAADVARLAEVEQAAGHGVDHVRGPYGEAALPFLVGHGRMGQGSVEGLVELELVDQQEEAVVGAGRGADPVAGGGHGLGAGEVLLRTEVGAGVVVIVAVGRAFGRKRRAVAEDPVMQGVANPSLPYASSRWRFRLSRGTAIRFLGFSGSRYLFRRGVGCEGRQQAPSRPRPGPAGGPTPPSAWHRADCGATPRYSCPRASRTRPAHRNDCGRPRCRPTCREPGARVGGAGS